jgi:hypothetical protein
MEQVTLLETRNHGATLVLLDGRWLAVNPGDIPTAILWLPTSLLEIADNEDARFFNLTVKRQGTSEEILARWD